jgi:3-phenylpropionate/trans-cinnamate dioxygenase ferredoxin reductase subunit
MGAGRAQGTIDYLLLGGGLAAATAAEALRQRDRAGSIIIVSGDAAYPYHRPPLSKEYLRGEIGTEGTYGAGGIYVHPLDWYESQHVEVLRGANAAALDAESRSVLLANGMTLHYRALLLATGGRARRLPIPGAHLPGVHTLRSLADADALRAELSAPGRRLVVIGSRFIGLEVAASAIMKGAYVTLVDATPRLWRGLMPPALSAYFQEYFTAQGAVLRLGHTPVALLAGADGRVGAVRIAPAQGGSTWEDIRCDVVVVGIGIDLNTELAAEAGLALGERRAVLVDDRMQTSVPEIFAAGDIVTYPDPLAGWMHFEHWDHAVASGQAAAANMTGATSFYHHVPYYFSDQFDLAINMLGYPFPNAQVVLRGSLADNAFSALYVYENRLVAALLVNDASQLDLLRDLIAAGPQVPGNPLVLGDQAFELASLRPSRTPPALP